MIYFAGLFDAEGYLSLCPNGAFNIAIEMANEEIPNLFKETFSGSIYERTRENRKKTWTWKINSINSQAIFFIDSIFKYSVVKHSQLIRLKDYLDQSRDDRRLTRAITCTTIKDYKTPAPITDFSRIEKPMEPHFFEWLAGFVDGDGNFVCNEYIDNRNKRKYFAHQISIANTFPEVMLYVNDRIPGCISNLHGAKNALFKWTAHREIEKFVCQSIYPFLKIKKEQCKLFLEFIEFPQKSRNIDYSLEDRKRMYAIINQIKHHNSL